MSIIICAVKPEHAWLGVDTDATWPGGVRRQVSKLLTLPQANVALAGRGNAGFLYAVHYRCLGWGVTSIEDALDRMPHLLIGVAAQIVLSGETYLDEKAGLDGRQEIYLVGWSQRLNRPEARVYQGDIATGIFTQTNIDVGSYAAAPAPWNPRTEGSPLLDSVADLAQVARAQVAKVRAEFHDCAAGGDFILARIERDRMTISRECDLGGGASKTPRSNGSAGVRPGVLV